MIPLDDATQFLLLEARLLDEARFDDWLALFTQDAWYWVPSMAGQASPHDTVSLIYDDRRLLETRVRRLSNPNIHAQTPPSRASRIVVNATIEDAGAAATLVRSKLLMVEYRRNDQRLFAATCWHRLVRGDGGLRIASKRVDLVNCDSELEGLVLPF
ncbi:MAG TPA: aromatic-ring-hydroxylating dioxygenase subunit beta [Stellaceae bacterium]|nr:aromatic-ring-hydroxylating dioxygenase subunit beta [Stellaceae bacterium]